MQTEKDGIRVGAFLLAALLATLFVCLRMASMTSMRTGPAYTLHATFDNIDGLKACSPASVSGVVVDRTTDAMLDPRTCLPRITLEIEQRYSHTPDTNSLSIRVSGSLGEQYLALNVSFKDPELGTAILEDGDTIRDTRSTMVLEDPIGRLLYGNKSDDSKNSGDTPAAAPGDGKTIEPMGAVK